MLAATTSHLLRTSSKLPRSLPRPLPRPLPRVPSSYFHSTAAVMIQVGDPVPSVELVEGKPENKVNLAKELGTGLIIGVPAAFSSICSDAHIPGYLSHPKIKNAGKVFVVAVNDAFVMSAWAKTLDPDKSSGIRFLADPSGTFTRALDVEFDASAILGNKRSKRYALVVKNGKVQSVNVEPDNIGVSVSAADKVLG